VRSRARVSEIIFSILAVVYFFSLPSVVYARRGCCSWHGGVCGCDTRVGRQVCCDGTYSPTCTCAYYPQKQYVSTPNFPKSIRATWKWFPNLNQAYDIEMKLDDPNPSQYSAVISKCRGCDPGPLVDFYSNNFIFKNVSSGTWYVNVKKKINGRWSNVVYWTIDVPEWVRPTSTPTPALEPTRTTVLGDQNASAKGPGVAAIVGALGLFSLISYYLGRRSV